MYALSGAQVIDELKSKRIEIGILQHPMPSFDFIQKPIFEDYFLLVIPKRMTVLSENVADVLRELLRYPYVSFGRSDRIPALLRYYKIGETPKVVRSVADWTCLEGLCQRQIGWSLIPKTYISLTTASYRTIAVPEHALPHTKFQILYGKEFSKVRWFTQLIGEMRSVF